MVFSFDIDGISYYINQVVTKVIKTMLFVQVYCRLICSVYFQFNLVAL